MTIQKGFSLKVVIKIWVVVQILKGVAGAQDPTMPPLRKGISVQMPIANHAVEVRAADEPNSTVIAITAGGKIFTGVQRIEPDALTKLSAETVYLKADSRVPFQTVLTVMDALRGKSVVLIAASSANVPRANSVWAHAIKLKVSSD